MIATSVIKAETRIHCRIFCECDENYRNSRPEVFWRKDALRNFTSKIKTKLNQPPILINFLGKFCVFLLVLSNFNFLSGSNLRVIVFLSLFQILIFNFEGEDRDGYCAIDNNKP